MMRLLRSLKSKKDQIKNSCPGAYGRVVSMIGRAKNGEKIRRKELFLELQGISNAIDWGHELY